MQILININILEKISIPTKVVEMVDNLSVKISVMMVHLLATNLLFYLEN